MEPRARRPGHGLRAFLPLFLLLMIQAAYPMDDTRGEGPMSLRYAQWTKNLIEDGHWGEALFALERASDFADVSSDISYLLALARSRETGDRRGVLEALEMALAVDSWTLYNAEAAELLKIENLIALRAFPEALFELSKVSDSPAAAVLTLKALAAFRPAEFRRALSGTLARYPRETEPARVFFRFLRASDAAGLIPEKEDFDLLALILRRLPVLLPDDPELAWMAAPYMRDTAGAARLVSAYRAVHAPVAAAIPPALKLGVISEDTALTELFGAEGAPFPDSGAAPPSGNSASGKTIDLELLDEVWELLRGEDARALFRRNLSAYTGVIKEDADRDGIPETSVEYAEGMLRGAAYDVNQDGVEDLAVHFEAGNPVRALALLPPERSPAPGGYPLRELPPSNVPPLPEESSELSVELSARDFSSGPPPAVRKSAEIRWERYPSVREVEFDGAKFIPRPLDFFFAPVRFEELWGSGALFPRRDSASPPLTRRLLVGRSLRVERASLEFSDGVEVVELALGIPVRAREYVGNLMVSETEFLRGRPQLQRLDLDFDGRLDTARFFRRPSGPMELEELWDYDRDYERIERIEHFE